VFHDLSDVGATTGNTPLVELSRISRGLPGRVLAKLESRNPGGSIKDRLAAALVDSRRQNGGQFDDWLMVAPPLVVNDDDCDELLSGLREAIAAAGEELLVRQ